MRDDIIEACALAAVNANRMLDGLESFASLHMTGDADLWLRDARAVLAAFKQATADPTPGMVEAAIIDRDDDADWSKIMEQAHYSLQAQLWQELGI